VEVAAGCYDQNLNLVPFKNIVTSSNNCKLITDFGYNGTIYKMVMGPAALVNGPATGVVTVTCNSAKSGQCVNWTIVPDTAPGSPIWTSQICTVPAASTTTRSGSMSQIRRGQLASHERQQIA
jgi:hypothetical protein